MRAKRQQSLKKDRNSSFSRFDTNLMKRERTVTERERGKRRSEKCQFGPRETEPSSHVQPNAVSSCPTRSLSISPTRRGLILSHAVPFYQPHTTRPHTTRPHTSARNGQLNGNPPIRAPSEGFRQGLGEN
jgi:hypothetical protein